MPDALQTALLFLINTIFDLYLLVLIIRLLLVAVRAYYYDTFTQFITKLTDFLVKPLRRLLPNMGNLETASLILIVLLEIIKYLLIFALNFTFPNIFGLLIVVVADALKLLINVFFYAIFIQVILSWVQPQSPLNHVLNRLTYPLMNPIRSVMPLINGIDLSPIPALMILQLLNILLVSPMMNFGLQLAAT